MQEHFIVVKCKNHFLLSYVSKLRWPHTEPAGKEQAWKDTLHLAALQGLLNGRRRASVARAGQR